LLYNAPTLSIYHEFFIGLAMGGQFGLYSLVRMFRWDPENETTWRIRVLFITDHVDLSIVREWHMVSITVKEVYLIALFCGVDDTVICRMIRFPFNFQNSTLKMILILSLEFLLITCYEEDDKRHCPGCHSPFSYGVKTFLSPNLGQVRSIVLCVNLKGVESYWHLHLSH
jgi:hypothetical protein